MKWLILVIKNYRKIVLWHLPWPPATPDTALVVLTVCHCCGAPETAMGERTAPFMVMTLGSADVAKMGLTMPPAPAPPAVMNSRGASPMMTISSTLALSTVRPCVYQFLLNVYVSNFPGSWNRTYNMCKKKKHFLSTVGGRCVLTEKHILPSSLFLLQGGKKVHKSVGERDYGRKRQEPSTVPHQSQGRYITVYVQ